MSLPIRPKPVPAHDGSSLSDRGLDLAKAGAMMDMFKTILENPYDPDKNPDGFVNIGTAENVRDVYFKIIKLKIIKHSFICEE